MPLTLDGTNGITQSGPSKANTYLDAAGGNTATVNGTLIPASGVTLVSTAATQTLTNKSIAASQLTGALPAIDGSALTGIVTGGITLLGTLTTTSGSTQTLSSLTLTSYVFIVAVFKDVSSTSTSSLRLNSISGEQLSASGGLTVGVSGIMWLHLATGVLSSATVSATPGNGAGPISPYTGYQSTITTASTSIVFAQGVGNFDAGTITVYGVK